MTRGRRERIGWVGGAALAVLLAAAATGKGAELPKIPDDREGEIRDRQGGQGQPAPRQC